MGIFTRKPKERKYTVHYKRTRDSATRSCSLRAVSEEQAKDLADGILEKQYGPQVYRYYLALRNEGGQVYMDANNEPIMSNEYEERHTYPLNKEGEQDEFLLQKYYEFDRCERG